MARMGEIIDGKYEVLREIGRGGMSVVYLAMDKRLNKQWAIKEFRKDKDDANKQAALKALLDEANMMKKFDHPTLPRIVDIIEETATVYVVMDYIEGESLNKVLDSYGAQPQEAVIEWAKQISEVLDYLHTQTPPVIYRDMKPANIMLKPDGTVRLIDFGIAREYKEGKVGDDTDVLGTRGYAAPEQFGGKGQTDARTDIYSFGVTLYHLVTGKNPSEPPYEIYPIRHWDASLSSGLEWMIQKCTQLNPSDRFQSCAEITYVLDNLDKFENEYKKKLKTKINLFAAMAALTIVFTLSSVVTLVADKNIRSNTYQSLIDEGTVEGYTEAIEQDPSNPKAYLKLANELKGNGYTIYKEEPEGGLGEGEMLAGDLIKSFSTTALNDLKKKYPAEYAQICYALGQIYWSNYVDSDGKTEGTNIMTEAEKYFRGVLDIGEGTAGLEPKKYKLAEMYYLLSFFQKKKDAMRARDEGASLEIDSGEVASKMIEGVEDGELENPYYSFWTTEQELVDMMKNESGDVKFEDEAIIGALPKVIYILGENYKDFYTETFAQEQSVTGDMMQSFVEDIKGIIRGLEQRDNGSSEERTEKIAKMKEDLNRTIESINGFKNYNVNLEAMD